MSTFSQQQWGELVEQTKSTLPSELGTQAPFFSIAAILSASPNSRLLAEFYTYLTQHDDNFRIEDAAQKFSLQLRDILLKQMSLIGAPQVLTVLTPLAAAQGSQREKAAASQQNEKWNNISQPDIHARGAATLYSIYGDLVHDTIFPQWGDHAADFRFNLTFGEYGLYLSDFEYLTPLESELVVLCTLSCLGLGLGPALWHTRGMGRLLGARGADEKHESVRKAKDMLRSIKVSNMAVIEFVGEEFVSRAKFDTWPNVGDVSRVLGGWGDDSPPRPIQ